MDLSKRSLREIIAITKAVNEKNFTTTKEIAEYVQLNEFYVNYTILNLIALNIIGFGKLLETDENEVYYVKNIYLYNETIKFFEEKMN